MNTNTNPTGKRWRIIQAASLREGDVIWIDADGCAGQVMQVDRGPKQGSEEDEVTVSLDILNTDESWDVSFAPTDRVEVRR